MTKNDFLKEFEWIKKELKNLGIKFDEYPSDDGFTYIRILSCDLGSNFYDYGEDEPEGFNWYEWIPEDFRDDLADSPVVYIIKCSECCRCSGW